MFVKADANNKIEIAFTIHAETHRFEIVVLFLGLGIFTLAAVVVNQRRLQHPSHPVSKFFGLSNIAHTCDQLDVETVQNVSNLVLIAELTCEETLEILVDFQHDSIAQNFAIVIVRHINSWHVIYRASAVGSVIFLTLHDRELEVSLIGPWNAQSEVIGV